ncbi:MAG TPA: nuclear transport factor 2 family protein [Gemmatimonadaceae bacterium]|nr:nuclear transport factor 2 family protein [Gemmatimonadaceae bacterium]
MRRSMAVAAVVVASLWGVTARAQTPAETLEKSLVVLETESWNAWKARDSAFFRKFLSDDHVEIQGGGIAGKSAVVAGVGSPGCVVKGFSLGQFKLTQFNENAAILTYHASQETECGGVAVPSPVWATSLYIMRDGRWQNAAYQQTKAAVPAPKS